MKKSIAYYILLTATWPMQLLPLEFHYLFSDFLYLFVYYVFRYRRKVVRLNLTNSFPEKSLEEIKTIERKFYHNFVDMFIETLYLTHISQKRHSKRLLYENIEIINNLYEQGKSVICVTGHYGNWEFTQLLPVHLKHKVYAVYKKLSVPFFDRFFKDLRSANGAILLEMNKTYKQLISDSNAGIPFFAGFIADQRPLEREIQFWMTFLNQDTPVLMGTEKIAKKTNAAVVWAEMQRIKRGYYKIVFRLLSENPVATNKFEITKLYMCELEKAIKRCPELWLWSHNRWKYKKNKYIN